MGRAEAVCVYMILVHSIMSTTRLVHRKTTPKLIPIPTQKGAEGSPLLEISVLYNSGDRDSGKPEPNSGGLASVTNSGDP
jgi:hypothetical protein